MVKLSEGQSPFAHQTAEPHARNKAIRRESMSRRMFAAFAVVMFSITLARAENWPQWRGPALNVVSSERNLPSKWTTEENVAWKLAMPAWSGSTPIIWRDRIFLNVAETDANIYLW